MVKVLVIPDIHLKLHILTKATEIIKRENPDKIVFLGDYGDDWGQIYNVKAYEDIAQSLNIFKDKYDCHFLLGNHDVTYILNQHERYTLHDYKGYHDFRLFLKELNPTIAIEIDGVVYSHAGIIENKPEYYQSLDELNYGILTDLYLSIDSPLWLRPQNFCVNHSTPPLQIVGHTPTTHFTTATESTSGDNPHLSTIILTDVFSTHPKTKEQIGESVFLIVENGEPRSVTC